MDVLGNQREEAQLTHWACMRAVETLLEHRADPNHCDASGECPLAEAAVAGNLEVCVLLLSHSANRNRPNGRGLRPLDMDLPSAARVLLEGATEGSSAEVPLQPEDTVGIGVGGEGGIDDDDESWWVGLPWEEMRHGFDSSTGTSRPSSEAKPVPTQDRGDCDEFS